MRVHVLAVLAVLVGACRPTSTGPFEAPDVVDRLVRALPQDWTLAETKSHEIPRGHYLENGYYGGTMLVLVGPSDVRLSWLDGSGTWHHDPVLVESLELWIMPSSYRDSWRSLVDVHRPVPATLVFSGRRTRVYGQASLRVKSQADFSKVLENAKATATPDAHPSWTTWKRDIHDLLAKDPSG